MAYPSVTNSFTNSTTMDAVKVNQNFSDIINGISDGTKNILCSSISSTGNIAIIGDILTTALTDYSSTVTVLGFSSYNSKTFFYKKIGKVVLIWFAVDGVSNSTSFKFSLPVIASSSMINVRIPILIYSSTISALNGSYAMMSSTPEIRISNSLVFDMVATTDNENWPLSGPKVATGNFFYEAA